MSTLRVKGILDFLLCEANVSNDLVLRNSSVFFNRSETTLRSRFLIAKQNDSEMDEKALLHIWKMSEKKFQEKY